MLSKSFDYWVNRKTDDVFSDLSAYASSEKPAERYIYIKNNAPVLCIAHLDTVQPLGAYHFAGLDVTYATGLDDRLGAWTIANLVDICPMDILLTDNEETANSTAGQFPHASDYNWIVEFDREGVDVVTYGLDSPEFLYELEEFGFDIGQGSFTDVCMLPDMDVCAVNVGIGTRMSHSRTNHVLWHDYHTQIDRFKAFYQEHKDTHFPLDKGGDYWDNIQDIDGLTRDYWDNVK